ncbi:MAG: hypothetical protein IJU96_09590 [Clostridia bacterium]|nr:hypothetical protein [Clostridia bacterium]
MPRNAKRIVTTVFALLFLAVALVFSFVLLTDRSLFAVKPNEAKLDQLGQGVEYEDETIPNDSPLIQVVDAKFLWEYGWQEVAEEQPEEVTQPTTEPKTEPVPETYFVAVTNWKGELVTDVYGQPVTQVQGYYLDYQYLLMTNAAGELVRDEEGNIVTEANEVTRTTEAPPLTMQDGHGNIVTKPNGEPVTKIAKSTVHVTNPSSVGAKYRGEGISDGEKYIGVRVVIDGTYDVCSNGVMTVGMTYKIDRKLYNKSLTYNIENGNCRVSRDEYYTGMVHLAKENNNMVITLYIPDSAQIPVDQMRLFSANSLMSTFRDSTGSYLDGFTVNIL